LLSETKEWLMVVREKQLQKRTNGRQTNQRQVILGRFDHSVLVRPILAASKKISGQTADR